MCDEFLNAFYRLRRWIAWSIGWLVLVAWMGSSACAGSTLVAGGQGIDERVSAEWIATLSPTSKPSSTPLPTITPTRDRMPTPTPKSGLRLCPPLPGYSFDDLQAAISNPFHPPPLGSDDPHQGVDFAVVQTGMALSGDPVQAALEGVIAGQILDRFPYGNAVMIETSLRSLPQDWLARLEIPDQAAATQVKSALTCPQIEGLPYPDGSVRSLYLLYAHLQEIQSFETGQPVGCGDQLGTIGQSGNALNPHLHLEVRVGPSGARFSSLAHYLTNASPLEMRNYCLWRVSGVFMRIDPMQLLAELN